GLMAFIRAAQVDAAMQQQAAAQAAAHGTAAGEEAWKQSNPQGGFVLQGATNNSSAPGHRTAWEAARAALQAEVPASVQANQEHGGLIYRHGGRFYATPAEIGTDQGVD